LSFREKLEFVYLAPYYFQATFFIIGTISWFLSDAVFRVHLPFWTATFGWSLVFTNFLSLPLINSVGLFLEEAEEKDYLGIASFVALSYIMVPFQAYAAIKGLIEGKEGPWFRTPKTGIITDVISKVRLGFWWRKLFPFGQPVPAVVSIDNTFLALTTANNRFNHFEIKPKRIRWVGKVVFAILLAFSVTIFSLTRGVPEVLATNPATTQYLSNDTTVTLTGAWKLLETVDTQDSTTNISMARNLAIGNYQYLPGSSNSTAGTKCGASPNGKGWILDTPFQSGGNIASGTWTFFIYESDNAPNRQGHIDVCVYKITVSGGSITGSTLLFQSQGDTSWSTTDILDNAVSQITQTTSSQSQFNFNANEYLYVEYWLDNETKVNEAAVTTTFYTGETGTNDPYIQMPTITIPENLVFFLAAAPFIPMIVLWMKKRKEAIELLNN
jgi:hypothetical protein